MIRREDFVKPLRTREDNAAIPDLYFTITPFEARKDNDYMCLDRVLANVCEPVLVSILVQRRRIPRRSKQRTPST